MGLMPLQDIGGSDLDKILIHQNDNDWMSFKGDMGMISTLDELKKIMSGIVGSFVIDEAGEVAAQSLPKKMEGNVQKMSKLIYLVINVMKATRPFDRVIMDSGDLKIIAMMTDGRILVVIAEKDTNLPLLKLVSNITLSRLRGAMGVSWSKKRVSSEEVNSLVNFYDTLYGVAAKKLYDIFGADSALMFDKRLKELKDEHSKLLAHVGFGLDGKPRISKLKLNAHSLTKSEIKSGLEDVLVSMLETIKDNAGPMIADKAIDEIIRLKEGRRRGLWAAKREV
jgi:predicted regulator of Ras-like GTPase activity (Roadblock/LC7/MglB family)